MGYTAYLTRDQFYPYWRSTNTDLISAAEFLNVVESDETLSIDLGNPDQVIWQGSELPFLYCAQCGDIAHNDPIPVVLDKMVQLASCLNAVVRGGDGEFWVSGTESQFPDHPDFDSTN